MDRDLIIDRGRLRGTRITVYNLLPYFLEPDTTEEHISSLYEITPQQVAALRAYALNHSDEVLAQHRRIEARIAAGNPPELAERLQRTHIEIEKFGRKLAEGKQAVDPNCLTQSPDEIPAHGEILDRRSSSEQGPQIKAS